MREEPNIELFNWIQETLLNSHDITLDNFDFYNQSL